MENLKGMHDIALKPLILRTLLKEDIPDEKTPFDTPAKLSRVLSYIQTHQLLYESSSPAVHSNDPQRQKHAQRWKSAVDEWVSRLLSLVTTTASRTTITPDKCWAGICLLGLTCQECNAERFLGSYALWFEKLLLHIQVCNLRVVSCKLAVVEAGRDKYQDLLFGPSDLLRSPVDSQVVKVAACTSMSDLITRLGGFPNVKKDGTALAGKVVQPVVKLLSEANSDAVVEGAIHLLRAAITFFPASLHRHYDSVEDAITSKVFSAKCSVNVLKKIASCLALLPKSKGDEDSWILIMRKILLLVNGYLTEVFHGLEEDTKWDGAVRLLLPPGEVPPPLLWGQKLLEDTSDQEKKRAKLSSISMLMLCSCTMLTNSYPVQVTIPVRSLLALVERVLMVDGSLRHGTSAYVILADQEFICSELPVLHSYSLELLTSIIKGLRSQLLPHAAYTVQLVKEYFRRCEVPELRIKLYSVTKLLLISMGVGIAMYLAQDVVKNSLLDVNPVSGDSSTIANVKASSEALLQPSQRKRKHGATGSLEQQHGRIGLEMETPKSHPRTPISVKIAALEALETLLTVGGSLRSESWRPMVDHRLITIATDSWKDANEERNNLLPVGPNSTFAGLQLAALRALLASLLSPTHARPPHLSQSLELFLRGRQETGTRLSEFCAYALLALEVLIHPRGLPLFDVSPPASFHESNHKLPGSIYSANQKGSTIFSSGDGMQELGLDPPHSEDDLFKSWLSNKDTEAPLDGVDELMDTDNSSDTVRVTVSKSPGRIEHQLEAACAGTRSYDDTVVVEPQQFQESLVLQESVKGASIPTATEDPIAKRDLTNTGASADVVMTDEGLGFRTGAGNTPDSIAKSTAFAFEPCHDSSLDSIPDIVDADPDSD